jgi:hypothetical protein
MAEVRQILSVAFHEHLTSASTNYNIASTHEGSVQNGPGILEKEAGSPQALVDRPLPTTVSLCAQPPRLLISVHHSFLINTSACAVFSCQAVPVASLT